MNVCKSTMIENLKWCIQCCNDTDYLKTYTQFGTEWNAVHNDPEVAFLLIALRRLIGERLAVTK
jgi:hypothetical protein